MGAAGRILEVAIALWLRSLRGHKAPLSHTSVRVCSHGADFPQRQIPSISTNLSVVPNMPQIVGF